MLVGGHPVAGVEAGKVDWPRKRSQGALCTQIKVHIEITHGEFAQRAIDRFAVTASGVVGFGDGSPMPFDSVNSYYVVGVLFGLEIDDQRRISVGSQGRSGEGCSFEAVRSVFAQDAAGGPCSVSQVVGHVVQKALDSVRGFQAAQLAQFGGGEGVHSLMQSIWWVRQKALTTKDTKGHKGMLGFKSCEQVRQFRRGIHGYIWRGFAKRVRGEAIGYAASPEVCVPAGDHIDGGITDH